jgi:hydroxymethylglutaryl-CoA lyase
MADHDALMRALPRRPGVAYPVLTPNLQGFEAAIAAGADYVAVFAAASEAFSRKNINCTIAESIARFEPVMAAARSHRVPVRGYVSCVLGCPYEGAVAPAKAAAVAQRLADIGCREISLGDTIGVGTPASVRRLLEACARVVPIERLAGHYHDTYGMAVANVHASYQFGLRSFDASVGGLGGCPYAKGATGNVATEDLVYLLHGLGAVTGIDLERLVDVAVWISARLGREPASRVARALLARRPTPAPR